VSDTYEHNPGDHEDPQGSATWLVGIVGTIIFIALVMGVTAMLKATVARTTDEVMVKTAPVELNQVIERDQQRLHAEPRVIAYRDVNDERRTRIAIPLDRAIELTAEQFAQQGRAAEAPGSGGG